MPPAKTEYPEIWPGPMEGIFTPHFIRTVSRLHLVQRWLTPFLHISNNIPARKKLREFTSVYRECGLPFTVQLLGSNLPLLGQVAAELHRDGIMYINLNFGCPSNRVTRHSGGGGCLKNPERLLQDLEKFCRYHSEPFSIKLRSGFNSPDEMRLLLPELQKNPQISKVFFHYRTVAELYYPVPAAERLRRFMLAAEMLTPVPLILNGDISNVEDGLELLAKTGAAGLMIARPWLRDPRLLRRFQGPEADAETARRQFFDSMNDGELTVGAGMELRKMLWGENSPQFQEACRRQQSAGKK